MTLLFSWLILSLAVWIAATILPGVRVKDFRGAILVAAIFGILNFFLGWLFFTVFTVATLGIALLLAFITRWVIDAIILTMTSSLTSAIEIDGFKWSLAAAFIMSVLGTLGQWLLFR